MLLEFLMHLKIIDWLYISLKPIDNWFLHEKSQHLSLKIEEFEQN